jgi:hypothetical protein
MSIEQLGKFAEGFSSWRKLVASMPDDEGRWRIFASAAHEIAQYIPKGLDKIVAVDELSDIASAYGLSNADEVQTILTDAFRDVVTSRVPDVLEPQRINGHDKTPALPLRAYKPRPFSQIPRRQWLHAGHYIRQHVVMTVAPGGYGKTALVMLNAIEMASGRGLIGPAPKAGRLRVLYWNAEEPEEEVERRLAAICIHHQVDQDGLSEFLFLGSTITEVHAIASSDRFGRAFIKDDVIALVDSFIRERGIDCVIFDPLVSFHQVKEADTIGMDRMIKGAFGRIAKERNCCVELSQHTRKPQINGELTVEDARGAGAITAAARSVRILNRMTVAEAETAGLSSEERRIHLRINRDKVNYVPPTKATWIELADVELPNRNGSDAGDHVQVVQKWDFPQPFDKVTTDDMRWTRDLVQRDGTYRVDPKAENWLGFKIAERLGLDVVDNKADRKQVGAIIKTWLEKGALAMVDGPGRGRHLVKYFRPGSWKDAEEDEDELPFDSD